MGVAISRGMATTVAIGGAGALDAVVLAGLIAVVLAEVVGESRERLGGGPVHDKERPQALDNEEFIIHEFQEGDDGQKDQPVDVNAVGIITERDLPAAHQADREITSGQQHILRVEESGELRRVSNTDLEDESYED